jgi:hypothetical protein
MLRLDQRQVRYAFSYAAQQASGIGYWTRDREHVEKAFDFGGMGARNGVTAATMVGWDARLSKIPSAVTTISTPRLAKSRRRKN